MMNAEFFTAIEDIEKEKGIPKEYMLDKIVQALLAAVRKEDPALGEGAVVEVDEAKKTIEVYVDYNVVEPEAVENPVLDLTLEQAKHIDKNAEIGGKVREKVETKQFGRIAAQAAKQVIIQGIREAERGMVFEEFTSKEHEILTGVVSRIDPKTGNVYMKIASNADYTEAVLTPSERVRSEIIRDGDRMKVYVVEVRRSTRGPQVIISRTHPGLVKRLFELEVPEIFDGVVEIKSIAREPGSRTKIAVASNDPNVDAIGACVGPKGARVNSIVNELRGEKIDIVLYDDDPEKFVASALAPAEVYSVSLGDDGKSCRVIVPDTQLSLAIGKEGKNARLAAKLTGCKIDIKPASEVMSSSPLRIDLSAFLENTEDEEGSEN
ncbi:MAG: transcription termination/antitermination protein NusA [Oscillospiraceae bacterium]|jgi:N utilization substance protein A|nr:transcription termination/antitermination protein NusA [Oscillospiraceae bacterium]